LPTPVDYLQPGQQVVVVSGPFQGMRGVLVEARGGSRVVVRVSAIRQAVSVEMDRRLLQRAGA
jgi:transcription antitermination factor NusG